LDKTTTPAQEDIQQTHAMVAATSVADISDDGGDGDSQTINSLASARTHLLDDRDVDTWGAVMNLETCVGSDGKLVLPEQTAAKVPEHGVAEKDGAGNLMDAGGAAVTNTSNLMDTDGTMTHTDGLTDTDDGLTDADGAAMPSTLKAKLKGIDDRIIPNFIERVHSGDTSGRLNTLLKWDRPPSMPELYEYAKKQKFYCGHVVRLVSLSGIEW